MKRYKYNYQTQKNQRKTNKKQESALMFFP